MSLKALAQNILHDRGLTAKKDFSQNFLVDKGVYHSIITAADLQKDDVVLEVGPGLGFLTTELLEHAGRVIAVEIDRDMVDGLQGMVEVSDSLEVIEGDVLSINIPELLQDRSVQNYKVVANIPYHITAKIIKTFLTTTQKPKKIVLLVQKEVAERMCEETGKHSLLSVSTQLYARPKIVRMVPKSSFYPKPQVDSAVIQLDVDDRYSSQIADEKVFWRIVRAGFSGKRKKVLNTLSVGLGLEKSVIEEALISCSTET
ncbi:MAG: 16S rRNA (adenine(1518)-N(6)/adenine(1519)-N(6))-dimethyltransferase RsmA [Patescibacteria group bacterium]